MNSSALANNLATTLTRPAVLIGGALLVVGITLVDVYQRFEPPASPAITNAAPPRSTATANLSVNENIINMNLFGAPQSEATPLEQAPEDIPETNLRLALKGAFAHSDPEQSSALVAEDLNSKAQLYFIDDSLPGGAKLEEVYADYVVIRRNGQREKLQFLRNVAGGQDDGHSSYNTGQPPAQPVYTPRESSSFTPPKPQPVAPTQSVDRSKNHGSIAEIRERIRQRDQK